MCVWHTSTRGRVSGLNRLGAGGQETHDVPGAPTSAMPRACCVQPYNPFCGALQPVFYFIAVHLHTPTCLCSCSPCSGLLECSYPHCLSSEDSKITASAVQLGFIKSHCHSHASCPSFLLLHFYI